MTSKDVTKGLMIYEGKAKRVYEVPGQPDLVWVEYKDDLTAFNAQKKGSFAGKGQINANITTLIYKYLNAHGVKTHLVSTVSAKELLCRKLKIIPLEVVTRNRLAGSTAKKLGIEEGKPLVQPLVEFYLKDDALGDPFLSDDQALAIGAATNQAELQDLKAAALQINRELQTLFREVGLELVDFKLEFGRDGAEQMMLGDEISPDTCRLWDLKSGEKMDKDRFRRDLGGVQEAYESVLERLENKWGKS